MTMPLYSDLDWAHSQRIQFDTNRMMAERIGAHGVSAEALAALAPLADAAHDALAVRRTAGELPFFDLPYQDIQSIVDLAERIRGRFDNFVVVGIGGSSLGPKATHQALRHPHYNLLDASDRGGPRLFFLENIDPAASVALFDMLDPKRTCINVVTKSGGTAETWANYLRCRQWLDAAGCIAVDHLVATTDPEQGDLRALADAEGWATLAVPPLVGGRFSQLTPVGLLPAAVCGIDIAELLAGAADMESRTRNMDLQNNPAYHLAALHYLADTTLNKPIAVLMPYADGLKGMADWFVQLWAESLGKAVDLSGKPVNLGQTPLPAVGAIDQHSQLQLFVEGPNDKMVSFMRMGGFADDAVIPALHSEVSAAGYLGGQSLGRLLDVELRATEMVLTDLGRPNLCIDIPSLNPFAVGQLFFLFEVMTAFAGGLYQVDPFNQPGVERGKVLTYGAMGREGYRNELA